VSYYQKTPTLTGTGKLASKSREHEAALRRQRVNGYGVTTGPLGTWVASNPKVKGGPAGGSDTWAA